MTQRSVTYLKGRFETGDIPTGTDYADLIDSFVNLEASASQSMAGKLELPAVSAATVSADVIHVQGRFINSYADLLPTGLAHSSAASVSADVTKIIVTAAASGERSVVLSNHHPGRTQYIVNDTASVTAANVFPSSGCNFIGTAANSQILLGIGQTIQVLHVNASSYAFVRY